MIIKGAKVYGENCTFEKKDINVEGERIVAGNASGDVLDASGLMAIPGLVDVHFHGAVGYDFCDGTLEAIEKIAEFEASKGVLSICPATMTYPEEKLNCIADAAAYFASLQANRELSPDYASLVGINMEGPFISPNKIGAQNPEYVSLPDEAMLRRLMKRSMGLIKLVDVAPETDGAQEFIKNVSADVNVSLAHTTADYETALEAFENGARHMTHLFNAMNGINHRLPGPVIAALEKKAEVELISDGIHIHPAMVRFVFSVFDSDKVVLISDTMRACGLADGQYDLGGQAVDVRGNVATLAEDGKTIAGSVTCLYDCMKKSVEFGVPLEKAVAAATINPAKAIGIATEFGSISTGKYADILLVDQDLNIKRIIKHGKVLK